MHNSKESCGRNVASETLDNAGFQVNQHGVSETLCHEGYTLIIGRDVSALPEVGEHFNIRWQMIEGVLPFARRLPVNRKQEDAQGQTKFHGGTCLSARIIADRSSALWKVPVCCVANLPARLRRLSLSIAEEKFS